MCRCSPLDLLPQMLALFLFLAFPGRMRIHNRCLHYGPYIFIVIRSSGKVLHPLCPSVRMRCSEHHGIQTIENDRDRKMTIMTTTFIPCSANFPIIALILQAPVHGKRCMVGNASAHICALGVLAIICSGSQQRRPENSLATRLPFVMELPASHASRGKCPQEHIGRGWSFIKKQVRSFLLSHNLYLGLPSSVLRTVPLVWLMTIVIPCWQLS